MKTFPQAHSFSLSDLSFKQVNKVCSLLDPGASQDGLNLIVRFLLQRVLMFSQFRKDDFVSNHQ
jgi:hypothetical protein